MVLGALAVQLPLADQYEKRVGTAMKFKILSLVGITVSLVGFALLWSSCSDREVNRPPSARVITPDQGGAAGYQHGIDHSKFSVGAGQHYVNEFGLLKVVGTEGVFAVDVANGLAVAIPNAHSTRGQLGTWFSQSPDQHNQLVMNYLVGAGIPKEQVAAVHASTSLAARASGEQVPAPEPKIGGYQSILDRKIGDIPVIDSVAWARLDDQGAVLAEWVYWPAIPGRVIAEASHMRETMARDADKKSFIAKLPPGLPPGNIVIRHSSATSTGAFVAKASYDVQERRPLPKPNAQPSDTTSGVRAIIIIHHFDADGNEFRLPQEQRNIGADFPTEKRPPPKARPQ
jgi:hypothetical protein